MLSPRNTRICENMMNEIPGYSDRMAQYNNDNDLVDDNGVNVCICREKYNRKQQCLMKKLMFRTGGGVDGRPETNEGAV